MSCRASVALVVSRVTIGLRVITWLTGVVWGSIPSAVTLRGHVRLTEGGKTLVGSPDMQGP